MGAHPCQNVISIKLFCNFIEITLRHGRSPVNLLHIFRTPFPKNTSGVLLLLLTYEISGNQSLNVKKLELCIKNSVKLTEKHMYQSLFFDEVASLQRGVLLTLL